MKARRKVLTLDKPKGWDLYRDGVTQGLLVNFLLCPERTRLSMVEMLRKDRGSREADFGTLVHNIIEDLYRDAGRSNPHNLLAELLDHYEKQLKADLKNKPGTTAQQWEEMEVTIAYARIMLPHYVTRWKKDFTYKWGGLEEEFDFIVEGPVTGKPIRIRGKVDGVPRSSKHLWVFESKTKGRIEEESILATLSYNFQVLLYILGIEQKYRERPAGVFYNMIRRPGLIRRTKKDPETIEEFIKRVDKDVRSRIDFYFIRYEATILDREIDKFKSTLRSALWLLENWVDGKFHYQNQASCQGVSGKCTFLPICGSGDLSGFYRRTEVFVELEDED